MMKRLNLYKLIISFLEIHSSKIKHKDWEYKRTIYNALRDAGGIYIKFLQILTVSHSFMDGWSTPHDYEVFNKVEDEYIDLDRYVPHREYYTFIERTPFACGSFAQVYRAKLNTGEDVVIKMLKPSVYNDLNRDLKYLKRLVKLIKIILPNKLIDVEEAFEEFSRNCLLETDYEAEIANMEYFIDYYKHHPRIVIPHIYKDLCAKNIIVQEYIDGVPLADLITDSNDDRPITIRAKEKTGSDFWSQIILAGGEALKTAMTSDYVYGDPHPGNIILLSDDKIAFIDFGLIAKKPISQEAFYLWVKAYYEVLSGSKDFTNLLQTTCLCFCPDLTNALTKYFETKDFISSISNILNEDAHCLISEGSAPSNVADNGHMISLFVDFIDSTKAIPLKLDMQNYQLLKAMQAFLCSITTIDNNEEVSMYSKVMMASMEYALDYCQKKGIAHDLPKSTKYSRDESYEILLEFLTAIADKDEFLFDKINERMFL